MMQEKLQSGFRSGNFGQALKEVASEFATSFIPTVVREGGKLFNDEHQKIAKEFRLNTQKEILQKVILNMITICEVENLINLHTSHNMKKTS